MYYDFHVLDHLRKFKFHVSAQRGKISKDDVWVEIMS